MPRADAKGSTRAEVEEEGEKAERKEAQQRRQQGRKTVTHLRV